MRRRLLLGTSPIAIKVFDIHPLSADQMISLQHSFWSHSVFVEVFSGAFDSDHANLTLKWMYIYTTSIYPSQLRWEGVEIIKVQYMTIPIFSTVTTLTKWLHVAQISPVFSPFQIAFMLAGWPQASYWPRRQRDLLLLRSVSLFWDTERARWTGESWGEHGDGHQPQYNGVIYPL